MVREDKLDDDKLNQGHLNKYYENISISQIGFIRRGQIPGVQVRYKLQKNLNR